MFDIRQAFRSLRRRPAYTAASVATLTLVIGVNAALFAAINATLFRPIPLQSGERTVSLYLMPPGLHDRIHRNPLHAVDLVRFRERSRTLTRFAAFTQTERVLGFGEEPVVVSTVAANAETLRLAPEPPILGRTFTDEEELRQERLIVLGHGAWQRRFGSDRAIVGRVVQLDAQPYTIVGVMPPDVEYPRGAQAWIPLAQHHARQIAADPNYRVDVDLTLLLA